MKRKRGALPKVAVVGAGLAGLSAVYHLRERALVTVFEREARIGGRVCTSQRPWGEHGAAFLLSKVNEQAGHGLLDHLGLQAESCESWDWPGYWFRGKLGHGDPRDAACSLLSQESARRVRNLFTDVRRERLGNSRGSLDQELVKRLKGDREAIAFVEMLLAGETCAPADHLQAGYGLECLSSLYDDWYTIRGGSEKLTDALCRRSGARIVLNARVDAVRERGGGALVTWSKRRARRSERFDAAIVTTPDGERLVGSPPKGHFHAYVSVLLEYDGEVRLCAEPGFDLSRGLYTDGPINYIQAVREPDAYVLRLPVPSAELMLRWGARAVIAHCIKALRALLTGVERFRNASIKKWRHGLPCGGDQSGRGFQQVGRRIFLAGDRFGRWPSMDAAVTSGGLAAIALSNCLALSRQLPQTGGLHADCRHRRYRSKRHQILKLFAG